MSDLLRATRPFSNFRRALMNEGCGVALVETSPRMRALQAKMLLGGSADASGGVDASDAADDDLSRAPMTAQMMGAEGVRLSWHASVDTVTAQNSKSSPSSPLPPTLFIANEFFDALPVHQLVHNGKGSAAAALDAAAAFLTCAVFAFATTCQTPTHSPPTSAWLEHMVVRATASAALKPLSFLNRATQQALAAPHEPPSPFVHGGFKIVLSDKPTVASMVHASTFIAVLMVSLCFVNPASNLLILFVQVYGESLWRSKLKQQPPQLQPQQQHQPHHLQPRKDHLSPPPPPPSPPPPPPPPPFTLLEVSPQSLKIMAAISKVREPPLF